eukprot:3118512-Rhodomonas_salina.1
MIVARVMIGSCSTRMTVAVSWFSLEAVWLWHQTPFVSLGPILCEIKPRASTRSVHAVRGGLRVSGLRCRELNRTCDEGQGVWVRADNECDAANGRRRDRGVARTRLPPSLLHQPRRVPRSSGQTQHTPVRCALCLESAKCSSKGVARLP